VTIFSQPFIRLRIKVSLHLLVIAEEVVAEIHPFPAVLYRPEAGADVTPFVAPPYDVIGAADRLALLDRSPYNIVRLTLPEAPPDGDCYAEAARLFHTWLQSGVLRALTIPALYVWEQEFRHEGTTHNRRALVAKVTCGPYQPGCVMPHERTYAGPKEDRLKLFRAAGTQFSQIFGIFPDEEGEVTDLLAEMTPQEPLRTARGDDGHISRLFAVTDETAIWRLRSSLRERTITIADGHHRYETSVDYYQGLGRVGSTLMSLVPGSDPGLVVLPTHRTINLSLEVQAFGHTLGDEFSVEMYPLENWPRLYQEATAHPSDGKILAAAAAADRVYRIEWRDGHSSSANGTSKVRGFNDVVVLHERILPRLSAVGPLDTEAFGYFHDADEAVAASRASGHWAFLLRPTSVETLIATAEDKGVLPPKSTYFYPKFLAGFINAYLD